MPERRRAGGWRLPPKLKAPQRAELAAGRLAVADTVQSVADAQAQLTRAKVTDPE